MEKLGLAGHLIAFGIAVALTAFWVNGQEWFPVLMISWMVLTMSFRQARQLGY